MTKMKATQSGLFHKFAKQIGHNNHSSHEHLVKECLEGLSPQEQVEKVAESSASVSQLYKPVDFSQLPAYLPSELPPQLEVYKVWKKIQGKKQT